MPNLTLITLTPPSLPVGYCPLNYQTLANDIISGTQATFNSSIGNSFFNFGSSTPALNNQVYPWLDEDGNWWVFNGGYWNRKHPVSITSSERRIFIGTTNDLLSYDGGDGTSNPPTNYTGAMWEVDTNFQARFPVGAGTFAASGVVTVGGTTTSTAIAGEDQHTLTVPEIPAHTHNFFPLVTADANNGGANGVQYGTTANVATSSTGGGAAHNNLPPFYGVYFIKRTARVYYTK
jgi:microcystin-dependent protein